MNTEIQVWLCECVIALVDFLTVLAIVLPVAGLFVSLALLIRRGPTLTDSTSTAPRSRRPSRSQGVRRKTAHADLAASSHGFGL